MHLKIINDLPHIVLGKTSTPASEVIAQAHSRIAAAHAMLTSLQQASADMQGKLEAALLAGQASAPIRIEQASLSELQADQQHEIADAQADITSVNRLLDQHRAEQIRQSDQAAIAELTKPFTLFLETHNVK